MVLTLVLVTFALLVAHDFYLQRRQARRLEVKDVATVAQAEATGFPMNVVGGFKAPAHLAYHPGHAWAMKESRQLVRIGLDDFAARVVGQIDQIDLPARGRWLRQGERGWTIGRGSHRFEMLSPIEGEIVEVNPAVLRDPSLAHQDPYGAGWLLAVNAPAVDGNLKNLLHGRLAQRWMEESVGALHTRLSPGSEARLQDGGHAIGDVLSLVPEFQWEKFVQEMLLG
ncbi:MAG TPA: glycine cleavage system protein H [Terriglobia bacterium]|nr:glycine cleavage system protein H [Terriglobia bacterium]